MRIHVFLKLKIIPTSKYRKYKNVSTNTGKYRKIKENTVNKGTL